MGADGGFVKGLAGALDSCWWAFKIRRSLPRPWRNWQTRKIQVLVSKDVLVQLQSAAFIPRGLLNGGVRFFLREREEHPKHEIRNNLKTGKEEISKKTTRARRFEFSAFAAFGFVSDFVLRISDFHQALSGPPISSQTAFPPSPIPRIGAGLLPR